MAPNPKPTSNSNHDSPTKPANASWDFLTNHAHVLVCVARDPGVRLRDIAAAVGITERAAQRIVSELVDEGYVTRQKEGRRNHYQVKANLPLRHPLAEEREVGELLHLLLENETVKSTPTRRAEDRS
jgi:DNA-binding IclR family transcriptional regulator